MRRWLGVAAAFAGLALGAAQSMAAVQINAAFSTPGLTTTVTCPAGEPISTSCARTSLVYTITSDNVADSGTGLNFTTTLPANLVLSTPYVEGGTCANAAAATNGTAGGTTVTVTNLSYVPNGSCTVFVDVTRAGTALNGSCATNPAPFTLTAGNFSAVSGGTVNALTSSCVTVGTFPALQPPAVRQGQGGLNCTANDVSLGQVNVVGTTQCIFGQPVTLNLTANITTTSTQRYDIGVFFSGDGNPLEPIPANGGAAFSSAVTLATAMGTVSNLDNDACLDTSSGVVANYPLGTINIICTPNPTTGLLDLVSLVTWNQSSSATDCGGPQDVNVGTKSKCTAGVTNTPVQVLGQINITKVTVPSPDVAMTGFQFSAPNTTTFDGMVFTPTPNPFFLQNGQTANLQTQPLTAGGTSYTITETPNPDYTLSSITCTDAAGAPNPAFATINVANGTVTAVMSTDNGILNCTYTNTLKPLSVNVTKVWTNGVPGDTVSLAIASSGTLTNNTPGSSTAPSTVTPASAVAVAGDTITVSEVFGGANKGTYTPSVACQQSNGTPVTVVNNQFTMPTRSVTCTFTNVAATAGVSLTKAWVNAVNGDTTALSITGPQVSGATAGSSTAPSTTTPATATAVSGSTVTLAETLGVGNAGAYTQGIACTSNGNPVTVTNGTITMPTTPTTCTITNTGSQTGVSVTKVWVNAVNGDTATLSITGAQVSNAVGGSSTAPATTTNATANAIAGSTVTVTEVLGAGNVNQNYSVQLVCTSSGSPVTVNAGSFTMPGAPVNCTFTNTGTTNTVSLGKTWVNAVNGDTTALTISGAQVSGATAGSSTAPATTTPATATAVTGSTVNIAELLGGANLGSYTPSVACTSNGAPVSVTANSFTMPATPVVCTFTNAGTASTVTLTKAWVNAVNGDTTALSITGPQVSGAVGGSSTAPSTTTNATATAVTATTVTIAEVLGVGNAGTYAQTATCSSNGSPIAVSVNNTFTMPATPVTCTITNTGNTSAITLTKVWVNSVSGDTATLTISGAQVSNAVGGTSSAPSTTVNATATAVSGSTVNVAEVLSGTNVGTYSQQLACTSNGAPITVTSGNFTAPATPVTCTFTNTNQAAAVTLTKTWVNSVTGDTATLTISGSGVTNAVGGNSTAPSTTTNATASAAIGSTVTVAEVLGASNTGVYTSSVACTSNGSPVTVTNNTFTMPATAVSCTFTNTQGATSVTLTKVFTGGTAGNAVSLTLSGGTGATPGTATVGGTTTPATIAVQPGNTVTLTEAFTVGAAANYNTTLACTNASGTFTYTAGALSGTLSIVGADVGKTIACTFTNAGQPVLTKSFNPTSFTVGGTTTLTFTITNPAANNPQQVVSFTDTLPSGLQIATTPAVTNSCVGGTVTANAGSNTITVAGTTVGASAATATSCAISVAVTNVTGQTNSSCSANPPAFTNAAGNIGGLSNLINGVQPSCVTVLPLQPTLTKSFSPTVIQLGGTTTLTFTVTNPAGNPSLTNVGFTDTLPSGLRIAAAPSVGGTCSNAAAATTAPAGGTTITVTNLNVPAGLSSCTVTVSITHAPGQTNSSCSGNPPAFTNAASNVTVTNVTNGINPSCVVINTFSFSITKTPSTGTVTAGSPLSFTIVVTNNGPAAADGSVITDPAIANYNVSGVSCVSTTGGATCPTPLTVAALQGSGMTVATFPANATITLSIDGTSTLTQGSMINTVTVSPPVGVPGVASASASATVAATVGVIPTLSIETLIGLMLMMAAFAAYAYRRRGMQK